MPAAATNRPGTSAAPDMSSSRRCPVPAHAGQVPQRGRPGRPDRRRGPAAPAPAPQLVGQLQVEVGRAHPHPLAELAESLVVQRRSQRGPGPGVGADAGDHQGRPRAVPAAQLRVQRVVLAALPGEQPVRQPVAVGGAHQVTGADHPGQRDPQRRLPDVEISGEPDQFGRRRPRGVGAEQHAQHDRPRRHPRAACGHPARPRTSCGRRRRTVRRGPSPRRGSRVRWPRRRRRGPPACAARRRRTPC